MCQAWREALVQGQKTGGLDQMPKAGETWRFWVSSVSVEDNAEEKEAAGGSSHGCGHGSGAPGSIP